HIIYNKYMQKYISHVVETISQCRKNKKMSQCELAEKVGIPQSHLSKIESGKVNIRLDSLTEILSALGLELVVIPRQKRGLIQQIISESSTAKLNQEIKPAYTLDGETDED
ncbi:helix-turn-helix domain-containing protein, partial [bacterium]|nr:helix-turn-helix domain-containing protein [bacterium]MBU1917564.1 helix-turn-helix domain-containing protein [bacterium]